MTIMTASTARRIVSAAQRCDATTIAGAYSDGELDAALDYIASELRRTPANAWTRVRLDGLREARAAIKSARRIAWQRGHDK